MPKRPSRLLLVMLAILIILVGCGGGGGGGGSTLVYRTDWSSRGNNVSGLSQRVSIYDTQGRFLSNIVVNQDTEGVMQVSFQLRPGTYRLFAELFSLRDLQGIRTGTLETLVTVSGTTVFASAVGKAPATLAVTPPSATFAVQQGQQFYATAYASTGEAVFVADDTLDWTTLGGVASVSEDGFVQGTSTGTGSVRVTHSPSLIQGGAALTVTQFTTTRTKWTVLLYLNAANDLQSFAKANVNQLERVASNPDVRFLIQWKEAQVQGTGTLNFIGTRRYLVRPDNSNSIASELIQDMGQNVDMGLPQTLNSFINWGKTYYPADRYVLIVWNHGNGWRRAPGDRNYPTRAVSYDDQTGNAIQTWQLPQALGSNVFDIVAWDASLMQMIEVAYQIRNQARYIAGSEESPPGEGYPYDLIFDNFRDNPDAPTSTLAKAFVDGMLEFPWIGRKITQSVLDASRLNALAQSVDTLADQLILNRSAIAADIPTIRASAQSYSPSSNPPRVYRDLYDLAVRIEAASTIPALDSAALAVKQALRDGPNPAVIWEGHNSLSAGSRGLSIDFSSSAQFAQANSSIDYSLLEFAQDTSWDEWLEIAP